MAVNESTSVASNNSGNKLDSYKSKLIIVKPFNKASFIIGMTFLLLITVTIYGFITFDYKDISIVEEILLTLQNVKTMFTQH